jgi:hypothetical protein
MEFFFSVILGLIIIGLSSRTAELERRVKRLESDKE